MIRQRLGYEDDPPIRKFRRSVKKLQMAAAMAGGWKNLGAADGGGEKPSSAIFEKGANACDQCLQSVSVATAAVLSASFHPQTF